ncbi:MAG: ferredoxin--NADP reductase, partial [Alphaproteobacteria bacterium]|nr:ferredoxin--NADP reductase [Alphaproteobacteria bacterium]
LEDAAGMTMDNAQDRAMICGSMAMLKDMCNLLVERGFVEGSNARPAGFVIEKAFVG